MPRALQVVGQAAEDDALAPGPVALGTRPLQRRDRVLAAARRLPGPSLPARLLGRRLPARRGAAGGPLPSAEEEPDRLGRDRERHDPGRLPRVPAPPARLRHEPKLPVAQRSAGATLTGSGSPETGRGVAGPVSPMTPPQRSAASTSPEQHRHRDRRDAGSAGSGERAGRRRHARRLPRAPESRPASRVLQTPRQARARPGRVSRGETDPGPSHFRARCRVGASAGQSRRGRRGPQRPILLADLDAAAKTLWRGPRPRMRRCQDFRPAGFGPLPRRRQGEAASTLCVLCVLCGLSRLPSQ